MDSLKRVVKVQSKTSDLNIIREIFSRCGEMYVCRRVSERFSRLMSTRQAIYPYMTSTAGSACFFIDFKDNEGSELAVNLKLDNPCIHIQSLAIYPHLIDQYRTVNPFAFKTHPKTIHAIGSISEDIPALADLERDPDAMKRRKTHHGGTSRIRPALTGFRDSRSFCSSPPLLLPSPKTSPTGVLLPTLKYSETSLSNRNDENLLSAVNSSLFPPTPPPSFTSPLTPSLVLPVSFPTSSLLPVASLPPPVSPTCAFPDNGGLSFSLETRIVMTLCGESIIYNLRSLDTDPKAIIELLRTTASERGNWMVVGAYYRRTGNIRAAITVVTTMIEGTFTVLLTFGNMADTYWNRIGIVMTQHNVAENDLKPAFLMLSGCENDLRKRARSSGAHASEVSEHSGKSRQWLQKVYGVNSPPQTSPQSTNALGLNITSSSRPVPPVQSKYKDINAPPIKPTAETASLHSRLDASVPSAPRQHPAPTPPAPIQIANHSPARYRILEREIQSLRDRQARQSTLLSESRSAKRDLEDDFACERNLRRKLERQLGDVEQDLATARRMETYALDQMKREVDTRRRAEERAELERGIRMEFERVSEKRTVKPLFEDLANMFQRAAKGEGVSFSGLGSQTGRASHQASPFLGDA